MIEAVTFDYWNTLLAETAAPVEMRRSLWTELLAEAGHTVDVDRINASFKHAWDHFDGHWRSNLVTDPATTARVAVEHLQLELGVPEIEALVDAYLGASALVPRELLPGVEEVLDRLKGLGVKVGIICDVGMVPSGQLRRWLQELGVAHLIDHYSFSDEVGVFKPHPDIFTHALVGLEVADAANTAHVGDTKRTDIAGARSMTMIAVRYTGARDDGAPGDGAPDPSAEEAEADHVIAHHDELLDVLGLRPRTVRDV